MPTDKALISNTSVFFRSHSFGYEIQKELRTEYQASIFGFQHHFKTTSILYIKLTNLYLSIFSLIKH